MTPNALAPCRRWTALPWLVFLLCCAGCAAGESGAPDEGDTQVAQDTSPQTDGDTGDTATVGDADPNDDVDTATDLDDDAADTTPDVEPVCTPLATECVDDATVATCRADGSGVDERPCGTGESCVEGVCELPPPICTPSAVSCADFETRRVCSVDGRAEMDESCAPGRCLDGVCSSGADTGAACTDAAECAGDSCQCAAGGCAGTPLEGGYCTTSQCDVVGCAPDEVCVDFGLGARDQPADCVLDCASGCTRAGFACRELPTPGDDGAVASWSEACYQADYPRDVGATCTGDTDCLGGACLTTTPSGGVITGGYCVAPCNDQQGCPSDSACVTIAGFNDDQGFCALRCLAGASGEPPSCPPERPVGVGVGCRLLARAEGGGTEQVCFEN